MKSNFDLNRTPLVLIWEVTRACDLACFHCRASAQACRDPRELSTEEGKKLIDDIEQLDPPIFIFTGGDPLKRPDIYELVAYAASKSLHPAMTPSATPLLNRDSLISLKQAGLKRLALSLDGATPAQHDAFRGVSGSFARTLDAMYWANSIGLPIQINTAVSRRNIGDLEDILSVIRSFRIVMWSLFFMVPTGRAEATDLPSAREFESAFARIYKLAKDVPFKVKTTEASLPALCSTTAEAGEARAGTCEWDTRPFTDQRRPRVHVRLALRRGPAERVSSSFRRQCASRQPPGHLPQF